MLMVIIAFMVSACVTSVRRLSEIYLENNNALYYTLVVFWVFLLLSLLITTIFTILMVITSLKKDKRNVNHALTAYNHVLSLDVCEHQDENLKRVVNELTDVDILDHLTNELHYLSRLTKKRHKQIKKAYVSMLINVIIFTIVIIFDLIVIYSR
ncbi:MAG: DUF5706 domain-containing protein [Oscillospiraceae bacterium]|nr:DUF5706 domain-containing protein [Oscillospiraceae bacterium]